MRAARPVGPRTLSARAAAAEAAEPSLRAAVAGGELRRLMLLVPDPHARFAATGLAGEFVVDTVLREGYGLCSYVLAWTPDREPLPGKEVRHYIDRYGDLRMRPDLATLAPLPGEAGTVLVVCDVERLDGSSADVAPRTVLREQLAGAERSGLVPSVGIEHEVTFTDDAGGPLTGAGLDYAAGGLDPLRPLLTELRSATDELGIGVESARGECHPGQYEIVLRHRDALAACDDAMLLQLVVRRVAAARHTRAGYLAAEHTGSGGSCHVHLSLADPDGRACTARTGTPSEPTGTFRKFLAGVLHAAPELTAIWAPTWNSYVRLRTAPFSPRMVRWGVDDRTAAVRLAGRGASLRMEARFAGADAQPHLVVAALLAAGTWGIWEGLDLPPEGEVVGELADTPWAALRVLTESALPRQLLGDAVVEHRAAVLAEELAAGCDAVTDWQRRRGDLRA